MARLFYVCVLVGVVLTVLLAGVYPLPQHTRYRSIVSVIPDGGREERFIMRWPEDRVQPLQAGRAGSIVLAAGGASFLSAADGGSASVEVFRMRDAAGNVIGLASRSTTANAGGTQDASWALLIPSRGTLFLSRQQGGGATSEGGSTGGSGRVTGGTGEFAALIGSYDEAREAGKPAADGSTSGQITLVTRVQAAP